MKMMYAFIERDLKSIPSTRKNGRTKYEWIEKRVQDALVMGMLNPYNSNQILYVRESKMNEAKNNPTNRHYLNLYFEDGRKATGLWQHGRYGSMTHRESVYVEYVNSKLHLVSVTSYASGQIKDQRKYLKGIE